MKEYFGEINMAHSYSTESLNLCLNRTLH